jgi:hypothetical protein
LAGAFSIGLATARGVLRAEGASGAFTAIIPGCGKSTDGRTSIFRNAIEECIIKIKKKNKRKTTFKVKRLHLMGELNIEVVIKGQDWDL